MFPEEIETERLRLRRLCRENVPTMRLYRHMRAGAPGMAAVSEYALWDPHETPRDTREYLREVERQWDDREQATYAVYPREDDPERAGTETATDGGVGTAPEPGGAETDPEPNGAETAPEPDGTNADPELAGTTNLHVDWERRAADLGIWLRKPFWGRGYSGERAAALLELAFDRLDLDVVEASHRDGNDRSRRAIEKYVSEFGGQYDGLLRNFVATDDGVRDLHRYTVTQEQYRDAVEDGDDSG